METTSTIQGPQAKASFAEPLLSARLQQRIARDFDERYYGTWGGRSLLHGRMPGADAIRLNGNDYLSLTGHERILHAQTAALQRDSEFAIQSSVFMLDGHPSRYLEQKLASMVGKNDALLCQSGYAANIGLLQGIADEHTPVYLDALAHTSLWEGALRSRAPARPFRHNDPEHLDRTLARHGPGVVVVDSVYSTTGALCRLEDILEVVERHDSMIVVDESHSLGTHGPDGRGLCIALGVAHRVHFVTASLAKSFAGRAGFFTTPAGQRNYLLSESFPNIFSSCLLPHEIAGLVATAEVIQGADAQRERLWRNTRRLRASLSDQGYPIHQGSEQIIALEAGGESATMILRDALEAHGIFGAVFCAPATSRNRSMVRLTLSAALTGAELDQVEAVMDTVAPLVQPWNWPIARRGMREDG